jgi:hypothetical protein
MRVILIRDGFPAEQQPLPVNSEAPPVVPDELRAALNHAPNLTGAAFVAADLDSALASWKISRSESQQWMGQEGFEISLLAMLLMLGRDLVLLGSPELTVSVE